MPIANCILSPTVRQKNATSHAGLIDLWAQYSGQTSAEMTITVLSGEQQFGKNYAAICSLHLPALWSSEAVTSLQLGLSRAISDYYQLEPSEVIVMTSIIESGNVVEGDNVIKW